MAISVPGVGDVPVVWMPASDEDYKDESEGGRSGYQPIAIVHHRAVTNLAGLDNTFAAKDADPLTVGSPGRAVSATFGIGLKNGKPEVHQYVNVSDTHYCNGDCRAVNFPAEPSRWDAWYGHKGHNERTVAIEHEDNGQFPSGTPGRGVVTETLIKVSIALDTLMLRGDIEAMRAAGIRIRDQATATALGKIVPGPKTLIDHNDIAGANKPTCWRAWAQDAGFPRARYISEITAALSPPVPVPPTTYTQAQVDAIVAAATANLEIQVSDLKTALATDAQRDELALAHLEAAKADLTN